LVSFDSVLFEDSPFVPPIRLQSAFQIAEMVTAGELHPVIAIASELRDVFGEQIQFLNAHMDWLTDKFSVNQDDLDDYYFGLILPTTLIVSAYTARHNPIDDVLKVYFPVSDDPFFDRLRGYGIRNIPLVDKLLHLESPDPLRSLAPVLNHCDFEVFSFTDWYQVGLQASRHTFQQFAQLY
jgi:hypothetical protein